RLRHAAPNPSRGPVELLTGSPTTGQTLMTLLSLNRNRRRMRALNRICTLLLLAAVGFIPVTARADVERDRPQGKSADAEARVEAAKNAVAADCEQGIATVQLDVNNVRADLYNTGQLFYPAGPGYEVPKGSGNHAIFATGLWIGGLADGELRMAAATYAQVGEDYEFFPG